MSVTMGLSENRYDDKSDDDQSNDGSVELELEVSQSGGSQSHSSETIHTHKSEAGSEEGLERSKESKAISRSKIVVLSIIVIAAAVIGTVTFAYMRNEEVNAFHTEYYSFASTLLDATSRESERMFSAVHSFGTTITIFAAATNMSWPFVTVPDFELRGFKNNQISNAVQTTFTPLVTVDNRAQWESYAIENQGWLTESLALRGPSSLATAQTRRRVASASSTSIPSHIWNFLGNSNYPVIEVGNGIDYGPGNYGPVWQQAPAPSNASIVNFDLLSNRDIEEVYKVMWETKMPVLSRVLDLDFLYSSAVAFNASNPTSFLMNPVYQSLASKMDAYQPEDLVGFLLAIIPWNVYFTGILPVGVNGMVVVVTSTCGDVVSYNINGPTVYFIGTGDWHDPTYNAMEVTAPFADFLQPRSAHTSNNSGCAYMIQVYPSATFEGSYTTSKPAVYTSVVILVFFFTAMVFLIYDWLVQRRQTKVAATAKRTAAIVASLFPSNVRDRILKEAEEQAEQEIKNSKNRIRLTAPKAQLKSFLNEEAEASKAFDTKPIADLFPETTVCFADLVGFTAWSSVREPSHVFQLLEALFGAFDSAARRRRVFKVETVGDCYVAVTGLPDPRKDHAVVMCRFARDCLQVMNDLTKRLEVTLGPDTGDLSMRFGLHSGPVTAGVLRGDKSRFQLFGDTVNVASRMESTGERNRIHLSQETADLLVAAGKGHWIEERKGKIHAKGKGELQTYWLTLHLQSGSSNKSGSTHSSEERDEASVGETDDKKLLPYLSKSVSVPNSPFDDKTQRLVEWNTDVLARLLKLVVARRLTSEAIRVEGLPEDSVHGSMKNELKSVLDEVVEIIHLPEFDVRSARGKVDAEKIELGDSVLQQLRDYVTIIASMYRDNPFHNFEHASHVTMSVVKLLSRIVAPDLQVQDSDDDHNVASTLHDHTYGITSDPLTQFACVFAALIHDVDHLGVPNIQLVKERTYIATMYKEKSVAEQNSVTVSWNLLMDVSFKDLRMAIYSNADEMQRFRQLVVNSVMATDIMDKDLKALRNARWDKAFKEASATESKKDAVDRKATIVIEHLIQASDIAHTMQHWHIYRKWNERLFHEMYKAYISNRAEQDPSAFWYAGEIGFFDFYIIPLAKKLKDCGVFGVSSDEYLNYAEKNRKEWEARGMEVVSAMVEKYTNQLSSQEACLDDVQDVGQGTLLADLPEEPADVITRREVHDSQLIQVDANEALMASTSQLPGQTDESSTSSSSSSSFAEAGEGNMDGESGVAPAKGPFGPHRGARIQTDSESDSLRQASLEAVDRTVPGDGTTSGRSTRSASMARSTVSPEQMLFL